MDNIFLIQVLQGEIDAMECLNEIDRKARDEVTVSETVAAFLRGAIEARSNAIERFIDRIIVAEKELAEQAKEMQA